MPHSLEAVEPYVLHLENLVENLKTSNFEVDHEAVGAALNGELSRTLRQLVPIEILHEFGAFFTAEAMADALVDSISQDIFNAGTVLDASCGGGNLLLAFARRMQIEDTWAETLEAWGTRISGFDINESFVRAAKARIALFAAQRGLSIHGPAFLTNQCIDSAELLPQLRTLNALENDWPATEVILLNPPFNRVAVPSWYKLGTGRVSLAALFIIKNLPKFKPGTKVKAILPDVLRSGSNYKKWRREVEKYAKIVAIQPLGQFDDDTQVDVFTLELEAGVFQNPAHVEWWEQNPDEEQINSEVVGKYFNVKVGRVVPHRDPEEGPERFYLDVNHIPAWETIQASNSIRKFLGTTFEAPFVIIRRNSRPRDKCRAVGTVVATREGVHDQFAVENHLLVVQPKSGSIEDCKKLLEVLKETSTTEWLNNRIRCRHLTVNAVNSIPYPISTK